MKREYSNYTIKIKGQHVYVGKTANFSKIKKLHNKLIEYFYKEFSEKIDLNWIARKYDGININDVITGFYINYEYINQNFYKKILNQELEYFSANKSVKKYIIIAISLLLSKSTLKDVSIEVENTFDNYITSYSNEMKLYYSQIPWTLANDIKTKWKQTINGDNSALYKTRFTTADTIKWYKQVIERSIEMVKADDYQGYVDNPKNVIMDINLWIANKELNQFTENEQNKNKE